jgi:hypothetical protein
VSSYRVRVGEGGVLVLQVLGYLDNEYGGYRCSAKWRDAKVEDIPVADPFAGFAPVRLSDTVAIGGD